MVLGIDLSRAYAQVSIYDKKNSTVDTLELLKCDNSCNIPTQLCKKKGLDEWYVGDEARRLELLSEGVIVDDIVTKVITKEEIIVDNVGVSYNTLMTHFLKKLIELVCPVGEVEYLTICFEEFTINLLDSVRKALEKLEVDLTKVEFINRSESDMYYVLSQNKDIWYGNVALFDYSAKGLIVSILEVHKNNGSEIVVINEHDFSAELPYISYRLYHRIGA